jgi:excinuclease ABC subunit C
VEGANDYAMLQEVLRRRFRRAISGEGTEPPRHQEHQESRSDYVESPLPEGEGQGDGPTHHPSPITHHSSWATLPDLVIIDGGKGQLSAALEVLDDLALASLPAVGLAKENEEIFQSGVSRGLMLPRNSQSLFLVQRIRDEAHRFAVTYHRKVRSKTGMRSALDEVRGVGPKRKKALINHFGTVKAIREASVEELSAVPGMTRAAAEKLKETLG